MNEDLFISQQPQKYDVRYIHFIKIIE